MDKDGSPSLIVLFQNLATESQDGQEIPRNAIAPKEWALFTRWKFEEADKGKTFIQIVQINWPDGSEFKRSDVPFATTDLIHQVTMNIIGFPIGQEGRIQLKLWLESDSHRVGVEHSFWLNVTHKKRTP